MLPNDARALLLPIARSAIVNALGGKASVRAPLPDWLYDQAACFVTLRKQGELRGCRGTVMAYRPLIDDLTANAVMAALVDPRCEPLQRKELNKTAIEVSILSPIEPILFTDEDDAISRLRAGVDGVFLDWHGCRGTFLPQVWHGLPDPREFIVQLKNKAGLPDDFWAEDLQLYRYTVSNWSETDLRESRLHV